MRQTGVMAMESPVGCAVRTGLMATESTDKRGNIFKISTQYAPCAPRIMAITMETRITPSYFPTNFRVLLGRYYLSIRQRPNGFFHFSPFTSHEFPRAFVAITSVRTAHPTGDTCYFSVFFRGHKYTTFSFAPLMPQVSKAI